jgi:hypothetical protein
MDKAVIAEHLTLAERKVDRQYGCDGPCKASLSTGWAAFP